MVKLIDPDGDYEDLISQRNVDVVERPSCGETKTFTFTIYNDATTAVTVDLGLITFNVPADWLVTTDPSGSLQLGPESEVTVTVTVDIPCPTTRQGVLDQRKVADLQLGSGSVPIIDVEGYVNGELVGGIELQFPPTIWDIYLPLIMRGWSDN